MLISWIRAVFSLVSISGLISRSDFAGFSFFSFFGLDCFSTVGVALTAALVRGLGGIALNLDISKSMRAHTYWTLDLREKRSILDISKSMRAHTYETLDRGWVELCNRVS